MGQRAKGHLSLRHGLLAIWALWPVLMPVIPLDPLSAIFERGLMLVYLLAAWLVWPITPQQRESLAVGLGWAAIAVSVYSICQRLGWDWIAYESPGQTSSFMGNPNFTAHFLWLAWALAKFASKNSAHAGYALMGVAIFLSGSRAVIGMWLVWILAVFFYKRRRRPWFNGLAVMIIAGAMLVTAKDLVTCLNYIAYPETYVTEFRQQPSLIADRDPWFRGKRFSIMTRVALYSNSGQLLVENPITGIGAGQFRAHYPSVAQAIMADVNLSDAYRAEAVHQGLMELAILYGLPWLIAGITLLWIGARKLVDRRYLLALVGQIILGLVSLNYRNPLIVVTLILFWPSQVPADPAVKERRWLRVFWLLPMGLILFDAWHGYVLQQTDWQKVPVFFPAHRASLAFADDALMPAWIAQKKALARDPFGPETIFNTGLIAWRIGESGDPHGYILAIQAFELNRRLHPDYRPARDRLLALVNSGRWLDEWTQLPRVSSAEEARIQWHRDVFLWKPLQVKNDSKIENP